MISVTAEKVSRSFGATKALSEISFEISKGQLFGFIGPDGSGKTTLFRIIATLLFPDKGKISVEGLDVLHDFKKIRKIVGYMPGRFSLYMDLTVEENLKFYATIFGTTIDENYHLIKEIYQQIEPFKKRRAGALSGGMKQKLALSCALIHKPEIIILDEPTTGVDAVSRKEFWEILKNLQKMDITIIVSTPYMDEAELCDKVGLIQNGDLLKIGEPIDIIKDFDRNLFAIRTDNIYKLLNDLRNYPNTYSVFPFGQFVHFISKNDEKTEKLTEYLLGQKHKNLEINRIQPNIEDCFMHMMLQKETLKK